MHLYLLPFSPVKGTLTYLLLLLVLPSPAFAGPDHVAAISRSEQKADQLLFQATVRQRHDFSCGAAALATLLIYHYGVMVTDGEVFDAMLKEGDEKKIRAEGFSMLHMKKYLDVSGYDSAGYQLSLDRLADIGLPGIALITYRGFNHFVVIKGVSLTEVLLGDPLLGIRTIPRSTFANIWNGMIFIIRSQPEVGLVSFNRDWEWEAGIRNTPLEERWPSRSSSGDIYTSVALEKGAMSGAGFRVVNR